MGNSWGMSVGRADERSPDSIVASHRCVHTVTVDELEPGVASRKVPVLTTVDNVADESSSANSPKAVSPG